METRQPEGLVLLVDDEPNILSALRRELQAWAAVRGLACQPFSAASEALSFLETEAGRVAIIISDLRMPGMKGSDFLLAVKARWPDIPTILLSGFSEAEELMKAVKAGIFSYVLKPWDADYLRTEIAKALELRSARDANRAYEKLLADELGWAGQFQRAFLRPSCPAPEGMEFQVSWRPLESLQCGGDYYDLIDLGGRRYLAMIGDVAGHGIKAAFVTGFLKVMIYSEYVLSRRGSAFSPAALLGWLNDRVAFEFRQSAELLITLFCAVVDLGAMRLIYANAGHNTPILLRNGEALSLRTSGPALGFTSPLDFEEAESPLAAGDCLMLYTDGLVESPGPGRNLDAGSLALRVPYGPEFAFRIVAESLKLSGTAGFTDDVTVAALRL
ncbi:MAG: SpoIIE family protein phosphatase [Spirochaetaceae bacterium]|nr:SpoIIE family protein phosphatase [Spirochaetaceae bacterium]